MQGLIAYRDLQGPRAGRTIALTWRATETRPGDLRALAGALRDGLPPGALAAA
jgi:hypothetical protein